MIKVGEAATERQVAFLRELLAERTCPTDAAGRLTQLIENDKLSKQQARESISWLLEQPVKPGIVPSRIRAMPVREPKPTTGKTNFQATQEVRNLNPATRAVKRDPATLLTSGVFRLDGEIYVIVPTRTRGRHKAKRLVHSPKRLTSSGDVIEFDYVEAPGIIWALEEEHRLPVAEIESMLIKYGRCIYPGCNIKLKDPRSVKAGVGKRHAARLGIPWGGK